MLTNPTDEVVAMVTNLYNNSCKQEKEATPFGMGANAMSTTSSIFGGSTNQNNAANGNLFGSSASPSNPFARTTGAFGAQPQNQPTPATNLFGASAVQTNSTNLFGASTNANTGGTNMFGGSSFGSANNTSAFGATNQTTSMFGGATTAGPFSQPANNASPFGMSATANQGNSLYGAKAANSIFGGNASFGNQVKPSIFGQPNAQPTNTGNIFGQNIQQPGFAQPANPFGNAQQTQSIFGGQQQQQTMQTADNPFAAVAQSNTNNIFGNAQMQQQQPSSFQAAPSAFGANTGMNMGQSLFGNQTANANPMLTAPANPMVAAPANPMVAAPASALSLQQQQQSIFGATSFAAQPPAPNPSPFGAFQKQPEQPTQSVFASQPQQNPFTSQAHQTVQLSATMYTPMDALSADEIEAFKSTAFDITKIPTKPPPMELCT